MKKLSINSQVIIYLLEHGYIIDDIIDAIEMYKWDYSEAVCQYLLDNDKNVIGCLTANWNGQDDFVIGYSLFEKKVSKEVCRRASNLVSWLDPVGGGEMTDDICDYNNNLPLEFYKGFIIHFLDKCIKLPGIEDIDWVSVNYRYGGKEGCISRMVDNKNKEKL